MKILFGSRLDGCPAPSDWTGLRRMVTGPSGILAAMEQNLGLPPATQPGLQRVLDYRDALEATSKGAFFSASLALDPLAVARKLLVWRDELAMAGWGPNPEDPGRFGDLAKAEAAFRGDPGMAERLHSVQTALEAGRNSAIEDLLRISPAETLPLAWRRVFSLLPVTSEARVPMTPAAAYGTTLHALQVRVLNQRNADPLRGDDTVRIYRDFSESALTECAAGQFGDLSSESVLLGSKESLTPLNLTLRNLDLPAVPAKEVTISAALSQLPVLALRLHWENFDPQAWLEFLLHPISPMGRGLRRRLASAINQIPGRGNETWNEAIRESLERAEDPKRIQDDLKTWVDMPTFPSQQGNGGILAETMKRLTKWAGQRGKHEENPAPWLRASGQFHELGQLLGRHQSITRVELERLLADWLDTAEAGSSTSGELGQVRTVSNPQQLLEPTDDVVWWQPSMDQPDRSPWTRTEREWLASKGVELLDPAAQRKERLVDQLRPVLFAKQSLTLFHTTSQNGRAATQPPVITRLVSECGNAILRDPVKETAMTTIAVQPLPQPKRWWKVSAPEVLIARKQESFSSLSKLVYSPYQWVFNYGAKLRLGSLAEYRVRDDARRQGSLLHGFVESLLEPEAEEFNESETVVELDDLKAPATGLLQTLVERLLSPESAIDWKSVDEKSVRGWVRDSWPDLLERQAAHYLIPGHESSRTSLLYLAQNALWELILQLRESKIVKAQCEERISGVPFGDSELGGFIDLHVERDDGQHAVIDLKLGGKTYRMRELIENRHLQLAIYGHMLEKQLNEISHCAYFIFKPRGTLLARSNDFFPNATLALPKAGSAVGDWQDCWDEFQTVWSWRCDQLKRGEIEFTVDGTEPDDASVPPQTHWQAKKGADKFSPYGTLTGWPTTA